MNINLPVFYSFRRCPYAMRARMTLRYAGIQVELREVILSNKPTDMLTVSPKGTVPVMMTDGEVLEESLDIMLWALGRNGPLGWLDDVEQATPLIEVNDTVFKTHLDGYKYAGKEQQEAKLDHRSAAEDHLAVINDRLGKRPFLLGDRPGLADIALMPFIRQLANVDIDWFKAQPYEQLQDWLHGLLGSTMFNEVMNKYPVWEKGEPVTVF